MTKFFHFIKSIPRPFLLSLLTGVFVGTSYIPMNGWALLFCYSPLWLASSELADNKLSKHVYLKKVFLYGWVSQFILTLIGFNWIFYVSTEFGQLHWSLSLAALLLFSALMHLYIPISLTLGAWAVKKFNIHSKLIRFLIFALSMSLFERIWPSIFEWNLAYTLLWIKFPLFQWADTVGFWGLSTWILLTQAFTTYALTFWKSERKKFFEIMAMTVIVLTILTGVGKMKEKIWSRVDQSVFFSIVQGNVGNFEKVQSEKGQQFHDYILNLYSELTEKQLKEHPESEVIIWPETALPFALDAYFQNGLVQKKLFNFVQSWNRPLITGGYSVSPNLRDHLGYPLMSNSVFFIGTNQTLAQEAYNKTDLLVFGEYMPLGEQFPYLYKLLPFVGVYKRGPGPSVREISLKDKIIKLGPQICYESLNSAFSRGLATKGSQILFNVTNDSWFGWWAEPYQHQIMTLARAIEVRRPLVRSTNTGISSVVLANGEILDDSPIGQSWSNTYEVKYLEKAPESIYTRFGYLDWIIWLILLLLLIYLNKNKGSHVHN